MDEPRKRSLRWLLGLVAVALAAGVFLVASALAGRGNGTPPAAPTKAKVTPAAKTPVKVRSHSGHKCRRDQAAPSSLDV